MLRHRASAAAKKNGAKAEPPKEDVVEITTSRSTASTLTSGDKEEDEFKALQKVGTKSDVGRKKMRKSVNDKVVKYSNPLVWVTSYRYARRKLLAEVDGLGPMGFFVLFLLPCIVDLVWTVLYFVERERDVLREDGPCFNITAPPSDWYRTPRSDWLLNTQIVFGTVTLFLWLPFRILYAGSYKFRHRVYFVVLLDLITALPFFVAIFSSEAATIYVPSFLRIWMFRFELGFLLSKRTMRGELILFAASCAAVGISMVAAFEWSDNNFPRNFGIFAWLQEEEEVYSCTDFFLSAYWLIVTLSTVGYGDVTPSNNVSRFVASFSIIVFIVLLPYSVGRITILISRSRDLKHLRYVARTHFDHVIVHGHLDETMLSHALYYFNPVRRSHQVSRNKDIEAAAAPSATQLLDSNKAANRSPGSYVVAMSDNAVSQEMLSRVDLGYQKSFISLFEGSLLDANDLARCKITYASAVFLLPTLHVYGDLAFKSHLATHGAGVNHLGVNHLGAEPPRQPSSRPRGLQSVDELSSPVDEAHADAEAKRVMARIRAKRQRVLRATETRNRLYKRDYRTLLRAWSAHQSIHADQLLVVVLFHAENKQYLLEHSTDESKPKRDASKSHGVPMAHRHNTQLRSRNLITLSIDAFQQDVMAASCLVPGFSTLLTNLFVGEDREVMLPSQVDTDEAIDGPLNVGNVGVEMTIDMDDADSDDEGNSKRKLDEHQHRDKVETEDLGRAPHSSERRGSLSKLVPTGLKVPSVGGFLFRSSRDISEPTSPRVPDSPSPGLGCTCDGIMDTVSVLRHYTRGLQNELEIMVIGEDNPFLGWTRLEFAVTVHRDFHVILLCVVPQDEFSQFRQTRQIFGNVKERLRVDDHLVLMGHGVHLDKLFHTKLGEYAKTSTHNANTGPSLDDNAEFRRTVKQRRSMLGSKHRKSKNAGASRGPTETIETLVQDDDSHGSDVVSPEIGAPLDLGETVPPQSDPPVVDLEKGPSEEENTGASVVVQKQDEEGGVPPGSSQGSAAERMDVSGSDHDDENENAQKEEQARQEARVAFVDEVSFSMDDNLSNRDLGEVGKGSTEDQTDANRDIRGPFLGPAREVHEAFVLSHGEAMKRVEHSSRRRHIILCAPATSPVESFIHTLRAVETSSKHHRPIIWLVPETPSEMVWEQVSQFPDVFWMLGDTSEPGDLLLAGIKSAADIVLFFDYFANYVPNPSNPEEAIEASDIDRDTIASHRVISVLISKHGLKRLRVHTHINRAENGQYLHESRWKRMILENAWSLDRSEREEVSGSVDGGAAKHGKNKDNFHPFSQGRKKRSVFNMNWIRLFKRRETHMDVSLQVLERLTSGIWPILLNESYAAGETWSAASFFSILFSSYVSGDCGLIFTFVQALIKSCGERGVNRGDYHGLRLTRLPRHFVGKTFGQLFKYCMTQHHCLCIGIFQRYGHGAWNDESGKPVVIVNPTQDLVLNSCDFLYLLGGTVA